MARPPFSAAPPSGGPVDHHDHHHDDDHDHEADHHSAHGADDHDHAHHHDHGHGHGHGHAHGGHVHAPTSFGRAFAIGIVLNIAFVAVEAGFGIAGNSMALLADAGHNLSDVLALVVAWVAAIAGERRPTPRFTYGLGASSILASLFNAVFLLLAVGAIGWEAILRLMAPEPVAGLTMVVVAGVGIVINGGTALLFAAGAAHDLNLRGVYAHMLVDALVSVGVVVAGLGVMATGAEWLDPLVSLIVVAVIVRGTWALVRETGALSVDAVPAGIDPAEVRAYLRDRPGVAALHDLHVWPVSTADVALTAHLVMPGGHPGDAFLETVADDLHRRFRIGHATLQIETSEGAWCRLAPDEVV